MKARLFLLPLASFLLLTFSTISTCRATVVTFDDLVDKHAGGGTLITNSYQGLVWSNFAVGNSIIERANNGMNGYYYGMITPSNVALNAFGTPSEIDAVTTNFNFLSAYLTGAWRSNLNIEIQGFNGGITLYATTVVASATAPTLFTFNYLNIDRLTFNSFGGQYAGFASGSGPNLVIDNFTFEFVPEPSTIVLAGVGVLLLSPLLKRKRA